MYGRGTLKKCFQLFSEIHSSLGTSCQIVSPFFFVGFGSGLE